MKYFLEWIGIETGVNSTTQGFSVKDWMTDDLQLCTRLDRLCALERNVFYERSFSEKPLLLEVIERIGCTKSILPSTNVRIVGDSVLDWKTRGRTLHTYKRCAVSFFFHKSIIWWEMFTNKKYYLCWVNQIKWVNWYEVVSPFSKENL